MPNKLIKTTLAPALIALAALGGSIAVPQAAEAKTTFQIQFGYGPYGVSKYHPLYKSSYHYRKRAMRSAFRKLRYNGYYDFRHARLINPYTTRVIATQGKYRKAKSYALIIDIYSGRVISRKVL